MRHEEHIRALGGVLADYGLDLRRYSDAHALGYLARFPDPAAWSGSEARSSLISTFAIGETTFMRHPEQFAAVRVLLPVLERAGLYRVQLGATLSRGGSVTRTLFLQHAGR